MEMMQLPISLVQSFVNYLTKRPWEEANPFLAEIQKYAPKKPEVKEEQKVEELSK